MSKFYKDFFIMINTLLKIRETLKRSQPKREKKVKEKKPKNLERVKAEHPPVKLSITENKDYNQENVAKQIENTTKQTRQATKPEEIPKSIPRIAENEIDFESLADTSKRTSIDHGPMIRVVLNEKNYVNPANTYVPSSVVTSNNSEIDEVDTLYHDNNHLNNGLDKVMDEFYSLD